MKTLALISLFLIAALGALQTDRFQVEENDGKCDWTITNRRSSEILQVTVNETQETGGSSNDRIFNWQTSTQVVRTSGTKKLDRDGEQTDVDYLKYECTECNVSDFKFVGNVEMLLFNEEGNYTLENGQVVQITQSGDVKFNFAVDNWTFESNKTTLTQKIYVALDTTTEEQGLEYVLGRFLNTAVTYGTFQVYYPEEAQVENKSEPVVVNRTGNYIDLEFKQFDQDNGGIWYDPTVMAITDPPPAGYNQYSTTKLRINYNEVRPEFYIYDLDQQLSKYLHVVPYTFTESDGSKNASLAGQIYKLDEIEMKITCGKELLDVYQITYTCTSCKTRTDELFGLTFKGYFINKTMDDCLFGPEYKVNVKQGDFKLDTTVDSWPWSANQTKNTIEYVIANNEDKTNTTSSTLLGRSKNDLDNFAINYAEECVVFNSTDVNDKKTQEAKVNSNDAETSVQLAYFTDGNSVYYDPIYYVTGNGSLLSFILLALLLLL